MSRTGERKERDESKEHKSNGEAASGSESTSVRGKLTACDLGNHLWQLGKKRLRKLPRPVKRDAVYF